MSTVTQHSGAGAGGHQTQGCLVCTAQSRAVFDFLVTRQYLLVKSESERQAFGATRGFCSFHMWLLRQIGDPLSLSRAWAPVVDAWTDELQQLVDDPTDEAVARIGSALPRPDSCSVCHVERETGAVELTRVLALLDAPDGREQFGRGEGLCLPHLLNALGAAPASGVARFLLVDLMRRLREVSGDLHSYADKRDATRRDLINEREQDAWERALRLIAGARTVRDVGPDLQRALQRDFE